jgi:hypothetical protein
VGQFQNAGDKTLRKKVESVASAAKAADGSKFFIAALKRCATQDQAYPAAA